MILDHSDYGNMCLKILEDKQSYEILKKAPTLEYQRDLFAILKRAKYIKLIEEREYKS